MGNYTILINLCLLAAQWIMLHDKPGSIMGRPAGKAITVSEIIVQFLISLAIAVILCLVFLHRLVAVREGTVICALLTGNLVKFYRWVFARCRAALFSLPLKKNTR